MPGKRNPTLYATRKSEILAQAPESILILSYQGPWLDHLARKMNCTVTKMLYYFGNRIGLLMAVLNQHLTEAFEQVRIPADWPGTPIEVLTSMAHGLLTHGTENRARHQVFLNETPRLKLQHRAAIDYNLSLLTNNFRAGLANLLPDARPETHHQAARTLVAQILHAPAWLTAETPFSPQAWITAQLTLAHLTLNQPGDPNPQPTPLLPKPEKPSDIPSFRPLLQAG